MTLYDILPIVAALGFTVYFLYYILMRPKEDLPTWQGAAVLGLAFLVWSLFAVSTEGPFGFWDEHTRHAWGNQIWFDILLAIGVSLVFLISEARALGMRVLPWFLFVLFTGSIGLMAFAARVFYLKQRAAKA